MPVFSERDKEKVHWMLYDRNPGDPGEMDGGESSGFQRLLRSGNVISFFQDIQRKTKLETNMDTSGMLSRNSFEVRAMRVIVAPLAEGEEAGGTDTTSTTTTTDSTGNSAEGGEGEGLTPLVMDQFIYNSVTTLRVGEKIYIEAPTFMFPAGAGSFGGNGESAVSNGEPNPMSTFRFAEPIIIPPQQSFRVEISFPRGLTSLPDLAESSVAVWCVLDGYLIRDVM